MVTEHPSWCAGCTRGKDAPGRGIVQSKSRSEFAASVYHQLVDLRLVQGHLSFGSLVLPGCPSASIFTIIFNRPPSSALVTDMVCVFATQVSLTRVWAAAGRGGQAKRRNSVCPLPTVTFRASLITARSSYLTALWSSTPSRHTYRNVHCILDIQRLGYIGRLDAFWCRLSIRILAWR